MRAPRTAAVSAALVLAAVMVRAQPQETPDAPAGTIEELRAQVQRVLDETGVPGAGLALVRANGIEWAGGVGFADRDAKTPVTADTHFRVGSISKTFVAMALVQMEGEGLVDLDEPLREIAPEIAVDNPWAATAPVRVIDLLQHTAGFDDMRFNEMYNLRDAPDLALAAVLRINPRSRRVRWAPGTRMSYSNPGYAVAGYVIEKLTNAPYDRYISEHIFEPLGMHTSSFQPPAEDEPGLARGYDSPGGPPVPWTPIYVRPAGSLHTSARELGAFVHMLLGWGEVGSTFVIDPEHLGNMERSRRTLAAEAGLRNAYGTGIVHMLRLPYPMLGHDGGIDGFLATYAYSPARDVGFVVLLNSTAAPAAMARISSLVLRYLKRDVEPPAKPEAQVPAERLREYEGYYHSTLFRSQVQAGLSWLTSGVTMTVNGNRLTADPVFGSRFELIPVSDALFRREMEVDASRVFTTDPEGRMVLTGMGAYAERRPRWRVEIVRVPVLLAGAVVLSPLAMPIFWLARRRRVAWRAVTGALLAAPLLLIVPYWLVSRMPLREWGVPNWRSALLFGGTVALPFLAFALVPLGHGAWRDGASRGLFAYALAVAAALGVLTAYLAYWDLLGIRLWAW